ncbi:MAG TPA: DUF4331 family protein [Polyangia bacterium]|nr:DUF4331 family protein [Polyangia bacterium]
MTTKTILIALLLAPLGCGDDTTNMQQDSGTNPDLSMSHPVDMAGPPAAPTLGAQIDRMGRPGINTAIVDPFWDDGVQTIDQHHAKQDAYNAASNPQSWSTTAIGATTVLPLFKAIIAAYDGLDTGLATAPNTCGNQLGYTSPISSTPYVTLATVLADDELYLDTTHTACTAYLGAEANALGLTNTDCGGRALSYNTIDITYNVLVIGTATTTPITSGVGSDGDGSPSDTAFPYLGAPN